MHLEHLLNPHPFYLDLQPAEPDARRFWGAYPTDELAYEDFIRCVLHLASKAIGQHITNAIVDFSSDAENTPLLKGLVVGGWNDPDCLHVGGASRVREDTEIVLQETPAFVQLVTREFSFLTADAPTWIEDATRQDACLYICLIKSLAKLVNTHEDTLYGWLERIFDFSSGKPTAYFSRYAPSPLIHAIANAHRVSLVHLPLETIPADALSNNRRFRQLRLTKAQWEDLERRFHDTGLRREADVMRQHSSL